MLGREVSIVNRPWLRPRRLRTRCTRWLNSPVGRERLLKPVGESRTRVVTAAGDSRAARAANSVPREKATRSAGSRTTSARKSWMAWAKSSGE